MWAQNRAEPRAQAVLKKMAEPGAILHLPARPSEDAAMLLSAGRYTADNRWPHVQSDISPYTFNSRLTFTFSPIDLSISTIALWISTIDLWISTMDLLISNSHMKLDTLLSGMACHKNRYPVDSAIRPLYNRRKRWKARVLTRALHWPSSVNTEEQATYRHWLTLPPKKDKPSKVTANVFTRTGYHNYFKNRKRKEQRSN